MLVCVNEVFLWPLISWKKSGAKAEKDHGGPQSDLPKDFVWPSCKVTSYALRLALRTVKFRK